MKILDETNSKILNILQEQRSITNAGLARLTGLAPATVFERVKKLEKSGIIKKYVVLVDPAKIGKNVIAFVFLTMANYSTAAIENLNEEIKKLPEVLEYLYCQL